MIDPWMVPFWVAIAGAFLMTVDWPYVRVFARELYREWRAQKQRDRILWEGGQEIVSQEVQKRWGVR